MGTACEGGRWCFRPLWREIGAIQNVFLCRLEREPIVCFVGVTAISNNFQCRLEILGGKLGKAGMRATGGHDGVPLCRRMYKWASKKAAGTLPYRY